jgi:hypothetical protein
MEHEDSDIVAHWLTINFKRLLGGLLAGLTASATALHLASHLSKHAGLDPHFLAKLYATILYGYTALDYTTPLYIVHQGYMILAGIGTFWALVFSHFVLTSKFFEQLAMGLVWAFLSWVFTWNLFSQSFSTIHSVELPAIGPVLVCLTYGLTLSILSLFDKIFKLVD